MPLKNKEKNREYVLMRRLNKIHNQKKKKVGQQDLRKTVYNQIKEAAFLYSYTRIITPIKQMSINETDLKKEN